MQLPLEGVRVVEVATFVAVPAAGAMLADLGADVIKVEVPPRGEIYRRGRLRYVGYTDCDFSEHPPFQMDNRGKRSVILDLTRSEAREALLLMIDRAEILITNLLPARRKKYGLDHASLHARHPGLVVGAISGYGHGGEEADRPAFDYTAYWARTGLMDAMRDEGLPPSLQRPGVGDHAAAMNLVCGILSALRLRDADGQGRYVDVSLLQTGLHIAGNDVSNALVTRCTGDAPAHSPSRPIVSLESTVEQLSGGRRPLDPPHDDRSGPLLAAALRGDRAPRAGDGSSLREWLRTGGERACTRAGARGGIRQADSRGMAIRARRGRAHLVARQPDGAASRPSVPPSRSRA
jgi:crotonobetainyl-CoA:carnitine CoA-transferase CaiB-like acyl-CoA transferase